MSSALLRRFGLVRMSGRDPHEQHRVASPLELFFDLVFVFAVTQLSHALLADLTLAGALRAGLLLLAAWERKALS